MAVQRKKLNRKNATVNKQYSKKPAKIIEKDSGPYGSITKLANKVTIEKENTPSGYHDEMEIYFENRKGRKVLISAPSYSSYRKEKKKWDKDTPTIRRTLHKKNKPWKSER